MHSSQDVLLRRLAHGVLLVVRQDDHVLSLVPKVLDQVRRHVPDVVDASSELTALTKVINADQKGFPPARASRVLKGIGMRGAGAERLRT
jgi:hypothetical protein